MSHPSSSNPSAGSMTAQLSHAGNPLSTPTFDGKPPKMCAGVWHKSSSRWAIVVDAKNDHAKEFYERYGFIAFAETSGRLYLPLQTFKKLVL